MCSSDLPGTVYGATPFADFDGLAELDLSDPDVMEKMEGTAKGHEVAEWLRLHPGKDIKYVIIDDAKWFPSRFQDHVVTTDPDVGLTEADAKQVIKMLT